MDKDLTVAHMMGKYKMVVVDNCGHVIQEDQPVKVAEAFIEFLATFKIPVNHSEQQYVTSVSGKKVLIGT